MTEAGSRRSNPERVETRRQQVLDAAAGCFRRSGFRGASMSEISAAAGMSTGHIYHYFKNKEAIVEAIVERHHETAMALIESVNGAGNILEAMIDRVGEAMATLSATTDPRLMVEIMTEASRNPQVRAIVQQRESLVQQRMEELLAAGQRQGVVDPRHDVRELRLLLCAACDGLALRSGLSSEDDPEVSVALHQLLLRRLLSPSAGS